MSNKTKPTPPAGEARWSCLSYNLNGPDENQVYSHEFILQQGDTGLTFVVSVAAESAAKVRAVVDALRVAQSHLVARGGGQMPGVRVGSLNG